MKKISELQEIYNDAVNYTQRQNKEFFLKLFHKTKELERLLLPTTYFLVGEKGTGKTAFAAFLNNNEYKNTRSRINYVGSTDFSKFITLKKEKKLDLSDFKSIWKVILLLILSKRLIDYFEKSGKSYAGPLSDLSKAINEYYASAFSPEIQYAMQFIENSKLAAEVLAKYFKASGEIGEEVKFTETKFQINLLYIERKFKSAIESLKLDFNHILFVDGVDVRPPDISYFEYIECIRGLGEAVWELNSEYFINIKDTKGRIKIVVLVRPDVMDKIGLQNVNSKIRDNSVLLNWSTTHTGHRESELFKVSDNIFFCQQDEFNSEGKCWDHYFPSASSASTNWASGAFRKILDMSWQRPRDVATVISILKDTRKTNNTLSDQHFSEAELSSPDFTRKYADYLLGEIKDYMSFYLSTSQFANTLVFFQFLDGGKVFTYDQFVASFQKFKKALGRKLDFFPPARNHDSFLQLLYEMNIICYRQESTDDQFFHWCYRERTTSEMFPKVKSDSTYQIHMGIAKALNIGKALSSKKVEPNNSETRGQSPRRRSQRGNRSTHP